MLEIIYEDPHILVCRKPVGVSCEDTNSENSVVFMIREHLCDQNAYVGTVHRLDTAVGGLMVYAKTPFAAARLSRDIQDKKIGKYYLAAVSGIPEKCGQMRDLLFKDSQHNKSFVVKRPRKGVKEAILNFETQKNVKYKDSDISLVKIKLETGRTHQIRVQFSSRKMPLLGDKKYGSRFDCQIALFSFKLSFTHPKTDEKLTFCIYPEKETFPFNLF